MTGGSSYPIQEVILSQSQAKARACSPAPGDGIAAHGKATLIAFAAQALIRAACPKHPPLNRVKQLLVSRSKSNDRASALFLAFVAIYSVPTFDLVTNIVGLGGIAIGIIPLFLNRWRVSSRPAR